MNILLKRKIYCGCKGIYFLKIQLIINLLYYSKTLKQLAKERDELNKIFRLAESLENQKRDEEKTKTLRELIQTKGIQID